MSHSFPFPTDNFAAFAFSSADILFEVDEDGKIVFCDGAIAGLLNKKKDDLMDSTFIELIANKHRKRVLNLLHALKRVHRVDAVSLSLALGEKEKESVPFKLSGVYVGHLGGRYYLSLRSEQHMQMPKGLDHRDTATGLLDKDVFAIQASDHIKKADAAGDAVEVTLLDFPGLKEAIDGLTPKQSKQLMGSIGDYLKSKSIDGDAAGMIARESYSIIHPGNISKEEMVADLQAIAKQKGGANLKLDIHASTLTTESDEYPLTTHDTANAVLYTMNKFAKNRGKEFTIESLNESYEEMLDSTLDGIVEFRKMLTGEEFSLAFQPIVNIRNGFVHHYECLMRLNDNAKFNNPFEFITFGEQSSLIQEFDMVMAQKALELIHEFRRGGQIIKLAINLSGKSLSSNLFMDTFLNMIRDNEDVRKQLMIEVTESYKIEDMQLADDFIQTLRKEGTLVCLDDFGAGESSFDYLRFLQVDFIKIDGSYIRDSMKSERGRNLLKAMAGLCKSLNMTAIGEMVEDSKEAEFLFECGVQYGQGYMFGKPDTDETTLKYSGKNMPGYSGIFNIRKFKDRESYGS